jgi:MFS family permease
VGALGLILGVLFLWRETVAPEPVIPLRLFRSSAFTICNAMAFVMGISLYGVVVFLPLYMQLVKGVSPTVSGLLLVPLMAGILTASILSGRAISGSGRYRGFAIAGAGMAAVGTLAMSTLGVHTNQGLMTLLLLVLGVGIGMSMPVLTIAVQNAVTWQDMGTATGSVNFFRSLGGSIGTAAFGAILVDTLAGNLKKTLSHHVLATLHGAKTITGSPSAVHALPRAVQSGIFLAFVKSLDTVFLVSAPVMALGFVLALLLKDIRLRDSVGFGEDRPKMSAASFLLEGAEFGLPSDEPAVLGPDGQIGLGSLDPAVPTNPRE